MMTPITATRIEIAAMTRKLESLSMFGVEITSANAITGSAIVMTKVLAASAIFWAEPKLERR
jgi:hypothetical protein